MLERCPGVTEAVVVAIPGATGSLVGAVASGGTGVDTAGLRQHAARHLPAWAQPEVVVLVDRLPRLPGGKTDREACLGLLLDAVAPPERDLVPRDVGPRGAPLGRRPVGRSLAEASPPARSRPGPRCRPPASGLARRGISGVRRARAGHHLLGPAPTGARLGGRSAGSAAVGLAPGLLAPRVPGYVHGVDGAAGRARSRRPARQDHHRRCRAPGGHARSWAASCSWDFTWARTSTRSSFARTGTGRRWRSVRSGDTAATTPRRGGCIRPRTWSCSRIPRGASVPLRAAAAIARGPDGCTSPPTASTEPRRSVSTSPAPPWCSARDG